MILVVKNKFFYAIRLFSVVERIKNLHLHLNCSMLEHLFKIRRVIYEKIIIKIILDFFQQPGISNITRLYLLFYII